MGICSQCNASLAAGPEPSVSPEAAGDAGLVRDTRQQFLDVLKQVEQQKADAAGAAPPPQPVMLAPIPHTTGAPLPVPHVEQTEAAAEPAQPAARKSRKGLIAILAAIGVALFKAKGVLLPVLGKLKFVLPALKFLKLGKILTTGGSMILSAALYATVFGWPYAVGLVLLILVHELGHMLVIWKSGLPTTAPIFVPFFGAAIFWKEMPRDAKMEAAIAFGGPVLGTVGTLLCYGVYVLTGAPLWLALAYVGCFINLLNLLPVLPLDGGRIMAAVSPRVWLIGMVAMVLLFIKFHSVFLILLVLLSLPRLIEAFRRTQDEKKARYYDVPRGTRALVAVAYCALAGFLGYLMLYAFETLG
jgi:Zn-dependent protease